MLSSGKGLEFARGILEKYGWKEGQGLGRKENGVTKALKPALKFDSSGIGYDGASEQFTSRWWEQSYNEVARSISITQSKGDVKVKQKNKKDLYKSRGSRPVSMYTTTDYNSFVKTSLLTGEGVMHSVESKQEVATEEEDIANEAPSGLTDEEIFQVCGGRTVHKGARHGLKLNGKLARIQRQEELLKCQLSASDNPDSLESSSSYKKPELLNILTKDTSNNIKEVVEECAFSSKKKKKKKKKKRSDNLLGCDIKTPEANEVELANDECNEIASPVNMIPDSTSSDLPLDPHNVHENKKSKKKKKKKKRRESEKCEGDNEKNNECDVTSSLFPESEKRRKRKREVDTDGCISNTLGRDEMRGSWVHSTDGECQQSVSPVFSPQQSCPLINCRKEITESSKLSGDLSVNTHKKRKHKNCHKSHE